jgi:hypothetical protein
MSEGQQTKEQTEGRNGGGTAQVSGKHESISTRIASNKDTPSGAQFQDVMGQAIQLESSYHTEGKEKKGYHSLYRD